MEQAASAMKKRLFINTFLGVERKAQSQINISLALTRSDRLQLLREGDSLIILHLAFFSFFDHRKSAGALRGGA
jgi:hypothetical protein